MISKIILKIFPKLKELKFSGWKTKLHAQCSGFRQIFSLHIIVILQNTKDKKKIQQGSRERNREKSPKPE